MERNIDFLKEQKNPYINMVLDSYADELEKHENVKASIHAMVEDDSLNHNTTSQNTIASLQNVKARVEAIELLIQRLTMMLNKGRLPEEEELTQITQTKKTI